MVHTNNRAGQSLLKRFRVSTNDPDTPMTELSIAGKVKSVVEIEPSRVRIVGFAEDNLTQQVKITPQDGNLFTIKEVKANRGADGISWKLEALGKEPPEKGYVLIITCDKDKEGHTSDLLMVQTDLKNKPAFRIPVTCKVFKKPTKDSKPSEEVQSKNE